MTYPNDPQGYPPPQPGYQPQFPQQGPMYPPPPPVPPQPGTRWGKCALATLIWVAVVYASLIALFGPPDSPNHAGRLLGIQLIPWAATSLVTWLIFRRKRVPFVAVLLVALPFYVVLFFFFGAMSLVPKN